MHLDNVAISETSFRVVFSTNHNSTDNVLDAKVLSSGGRAREKGNKKQMCFLQDT